MDITNNNNNNSEIRVWVDGCFDMLHFGHANALRQAKGLGDKLIVGFHSDEEIRHNKGPPVFTESERHTMLKSVKWVDEVIPNSPYVTEISVMDKYNCDFCAHGDDITVGSDGKDTYHKVKALKRYKEFKRTEGISTTNLLQRILRKFSNSNGPLNSSQELSQYTTGSNFYPNTKLLSLFQHDCIEPKQDDIIIYAPGSYDMYHVGHAMFLEKCRKLGTYVIVGLYSDEYLKKIKGQDYPIMTFYERLFCILGCKYVDNIIMAPPAEISESFIKDYKINQVVHGKIDLENLGDCFKVPKELGIFQVVDSGSDLSWDRLIERIIANEVLFEERNYKKQLKEVVFLSN